MSVLREYAVFGDPVDGGRTLMLRRGFSSRDAAFDHPVTPKYWRKIWVEEVTSRKRMDSAPPFPWRVVWQGQFCYVVDADGSKIACLLGSQKRREHTASALYDLGIAGNAEAISA